jgi:hypothetical protein
MSAEVMYRMSVTKANLSPGVLLFAQKRVSGGHDLNAFRAASAEDKRVSTETYGECSARVVADMIGTRQS